MTNIVVGSTGEIISLPYTANGYYELLMGDGERIRCDTLLTAAGLQSLVRVSGVAGSECSVPPTRQLQLPTHRAAAIVQASSLHAETEFLALEAENE